MQEQNINPPPEQIQPSHQGYPRLPSDNHNVENIPPVKQRFVRRLTDELRRLMVAKMFQPKPDQPNKDITTFTANPLGQLKQHFERRKKYQTFAKLREQMHWDMSLRCMERVGTNPQQTEEEQSLGVYLEELEPTVLYAVREFNRKGYKTFSSGFYGKNHDLQEMSGHFFLDRDTKQKFNQMNVEVETIPWWKYQSDMSLGLADSNISEEEKFETIVRFRPKQPDLQEIETKWRQIADVLPDRASKW